MKPTLSLLIATLLYAGTPISAWGPSTHETIALLALRHALPETITWLQANRLLPATHGSTGSGSVRDSIAYISTWADGYADQCEDGRWSRELHYVNAGGSSTSEPLTLTCGVEYERDCAGGRCVLGAIVNYTAIQHPPSFTTTDPICQHPRKPGPSHSPSPAQTPLSPETLSPAQIALRLLIHLIADIHQPLHTTSYLHGGNALPVSFATHKSNLHALWDNQIPETTFRRLTPGWTEGKGAEGVVEYLYQHVVQMDKSTAEWREDWVGGCFAGIESEAAGGRGISAERAHKCALQWARWANGYLCTHVLRFKDGAETVEVGAGRELDGEYTEQAERVVVELVGMAGWRLGGWLNLLATGRVGLDLGGAETEGGGGGGGGVGVGDKDGGGEEADDDDHFRGRFTVLPEWVRDEL